MQPTIPLSPGLRLRWWSAFALAFLQVASACSVIAAERHESRAVYQGSKFGIDIDYEVRIQYESSDAPALQWMQLPNDELSGARSIESVSRWAHVVVKRRILGAVTVSDALVDPARGRTIQRIVQRPGDRYVSYKATQFGSTGIRLLRLRKDNAERSVDWMQAKPSRLAYPDWLGNEPGVSDPNSLFYLLGSEPLQHPGAVLQLPLFSNNQLLLVTLHARDLTNAEAALIESAGGTERAINGRREALLVSIEAKYLDPGSAAEDMTVLGMRGRIEMLMDREWGVPLQISGRVPKFGTVQLHLERVEFKTRD